MTVRLVAVLSILISTAVAAAPSEAKIKKKTINAPLKFMHGQNPNDPGNCSAVGVAEIPRQIGATSAAVDWSVNTSTTPRKASKVVASPIFDDVVHYVTIYKAPLGKHWLVITSGASDGPKVNDCSETEARLRNVVVGNQVKIVLSYEADGDVACENQRAAVRQYQVKFNTASRAEQAAERGSASRKRLEIYRKAASERLTRARQLRSKACAVKLNPR